MKDIRVALVGNPNAGKSSIFNSLTGAKQKIANYPGVTVDIKEGSIKQKDVNIVIYDLPGIYSLFSQSEEEVIARDFIVTEKIDVILNVIDVSNIDRNLNLTLQLMDLNIPMVAVLNMSDIAESNGYSIDYHKLSSMLAMPTVKAVGSKGVGSGNIVLELERIANGEWVNNYPRIDYGKDVETEIEWLCNKLVVPLDITTKYSKRYVIVKLLEDDEAMHEVLYVGKNIDLLNRSKDKINSLTGDDSAVFISYARHGYITGIVRESVDKRVIDRINVSDKLDKVLANRVIGLPIFFGLMYLLFEMVFTIGDPFMGWIETGFEILSNALHNNWNVETLPLLRSLLINGIIGGVGGVIVFLPNIILLFFAIALLEGTGYMARVAFIMDKIMNKFGLQGKSIIPMLVGFGCTVPAIMATRTLDSRRDRLITMMVAPLVSCGARLPIYALIIPAFFAEDIQAAMLFLIYIIGIVLAIIFSKILGSTIFKGEARTFIMEMPPYRMPTFKGLLIHTWDRSYMYLRKAGTMILAVSIAIWAMMTFPALPVAETDMYERERTVVVSSNILEDEKESQILDIDNRELEAGLVYSVAGRIGKAIEPPLSLLGFDWKIGVALIGAFAAKEVFVAQLGIVYSIGEATEESQTLREKLAYNYSPLVALCIMLFALISTPCVATMVVTAKESGSWKYAAMQLVGLTLLAYIISLIVYQVGTFLGY